MATWNACLLSADDTVALADLVRHTDIDVLLVQEFKVGPSRCSLTSVGDYCVLVGSTDTRLKVPAILIHRRLARRMEVSYSSAKMIAFDLFTDPCDDDDVTISDIADMSSVTGATPEAGVRSSCSAGSAAGGRGGGAPTG